MSKPGTTADVVMEAIEDLHMQEQVVTRETLAELTGLQLSVIDDRIAHLINNGKVQRIQRGVFVPAHRHPTARLISKLVLPDGTACIEIGDDHVIKLTPREHRTLGEMMVGAGMQYATIELGHQAGRLSAEIRQDMNDIRRQVAMLSKRVGRGGKGSPADAESDQGVMQVEK